MDLTEFALAARGGKVENGIFATNGDPFAVLLGFDLKATYRLDKKQEATRRMTLPIRKMNSDKSATLIAPPTGASDGTTRSDAMVISRHGRR